MSDTQMDYSAATSIDELYANLGASEIKRLYHENESFKTTLDKLNLTEGRAKLISDFQNQSEAEQQLAYARMSTVNKAIIDQDYDAFEAKQTQILAPSQDDTDAARAAEAVAVEPTPIEIEAVPVAEVVVPVVVESVEELYDGIEKIGASSYKLTVDPEDGTPVEIFFGTTQKECFKALRKSKGNATRELRRRAKKIQITDELRALKVEVVNYPPLATPVILTPDQIYTYTEQLKDPTTVLEATRQLRLASITPEECARQNEETERRRYENGYNTAISWIHTHPEFYNCDENIAALQKFMGDLNWAVTIKNLDLAFANLTEQGVLLERPEEQEQVQPTPQPAYVVPVVVESAVPAAAPVVAVAPPPVAPAAPAGALPAATRVLRPASSSTSAMPTRRIDSVSTAPPTVVLTVEEYNRIPATEAKRLYEKDPVFRKGFDALAAAGKI